MASESRFQRIEAPHEHMSTCSYEHMNLGFRLLPLFHPGLHRCLHKANE